MRTLLIIALLLLHHNIFAQDDRLFATQQVHKRLISENPSFSENQNKIESVIRDFSIEKKLKKITIPVVFHIIYNDDESRIDETKILSQLNAINEHFSIENFDKEHVSYRKEGFDLKNPKNLEIEFCFPKDGPDGKKTDGFNFIETSVTEWSTEDAVKSSGTEGIEPWDPDAYLNVWVCRLADGISGYAQMPGGPKSTDGIVIDYRFFGTENLLNERYSEGKTFTHLVGNYLGLHDLWGLGRCQDDYVDDTPIHNSANTGCPEYKHLSTCEGYPVEIVMNFMDNTDDPCMFMFTLGQMIRMRGMLSAEGPRIGLLNTKTKCNQPNLSPLVVSQNREPKINLYPNPARTYITLDLYNEDVGNLNITVYDARGSIVHQGEISQTDTYEKFDIDISNWSSGLYFFHVLMNGKPVLKPFPLQKL